MLKTETVNGINERLEEFNNKNSRLENRVDALDTASSEHNTEMTDMRSEVSGLQSTLDQILENNPQLETNVEALQDRNNEVWTKLLDLQFTITQVSARLSTHTQDATNRMVELERAISPIRNELGDLRNGTVTRMREDINALQASQS